MTKLTAWGDLIDAATNGRHLTIFLSRATERRLAANIDRFNRDFPDDPMDATDDDDLGVVLLACADRGLCAGESDEGVWTDLVGRPSPLPRTVRAPWPMRLRFAVRAAVTTWRST